MYWATLFASPHPPFTLTFNEFFISTKNAAKIKNKFHVSFQVIDLLIGGFRKTWIPDEAWLTQQPPDHRTSAHTFATYIMFSLTSALVLLGAAAAQGSACVVSPVFSLCIVFF